MSQANEEAPRVVPSVRAHHALRPVIGRRTLRLLAFVNDNAAMITGRYMDL